MIVTFFGHRNFSPSEAHKKSLFLILKKLIGDQYVEFYLGGYGNFDAFSYECCKGYKKTHINARLIFVTPYLFSNNLKEKSERYDLVIYPEIENIPPNIAATKRTVYITETAGTKIKFINTAIIEK